MAGRPSHDNTLKNKFLEHMTSARVVTCRLHSWKDFLLMSFYGISNIDHTLFSFESCGRLVKFYMLDLLVGTCLPHYLYIKETRKKQLYVNLSLHYGNLIQLVKTELNRNPTTGNFAEIENLHIT